jgi:hemolysin-activating ACP:hemolysin acyltransferase
MRGNANQSTDKIFKVVDLIKQSIPFAYMAVSVASTDNTPHSVQVYSDISAEWVSGDNSMLVNWTTTMGNILTHQVQLQTQTVFSEVNDRIQRNHFSV